MIYAKLNFGEHQEYPCLKAANDTTALANMLPSIEGRNAVVTSSRSCAIHAASCITCVGGGPCKISETEAGELGLSANRFEHLERVVFRNFSGNYG